MIRFTCPKCGKHLKAQEAYAGKPVKCNRCGLSQPVPTEPKPFPPDTAEQVPASSDHAPKNVAAGNGRGESSSPSQRRCQTEDARFPGVRLHRSRRRSPAAARLGRRRTAAARGRPWGVLPPHSRRVGPQAGGPEIQRSEHQQTGPRMARRDHPQGHPTRQGDRGPGTVAVRRRHSQEPRPRPVAARLSHLGRQGQYAGHDPHGASVEDARVEPQEDRPGDGCPRQDAGRARRRRPRRETARSQAPRSGRRCPETPGTQGGTGRPGIPI